MNTLKVFVFPPRVSFDFPYNNQFYVKYVKNYNNFKKRQKIEGFNGEAYYMDDEYGINELQAIIAELEKPIMYGRLRKIRDIYGEV